MCAEDSAHLAVLWHVLMYLTVGDTGTCLAVTAGPIVAATRQGYGIGGAGTPVRVYYVWLVH